MLSYSVRYTHAHANDIFYLLLHWKLHLVAHISLCQFALQYVKINNISTTLLNLFVNFKDFKIKKTNNNNNNGGIV